MIDRHILLEHDRVGLGDAIVRALHLLRAAGGIPGADPYEGLREWTIFPYAINRHGWRKWAFKLTHGMLWRQEGFNRSLLTAQNAGSSGGSQDKPDIVIFAPFHVRAMRSGGAVRVGGMARALAVHGRVLVVSIEDDYLADRQSPWPGVSLVSIPRSSAFIRATEEVKPIYGYYRHFLTVAQRPELLPELRYVLEELVPSAHAVMAVGPFAWPLLAPLADGKIVLYDSHDDVMQYLDMVNFDADRARTTDAIAKLEQDLCRRANVISMTTGEDAEKLRARCPEASAKTVVVRNGVDLSSARMTTPSEARRLARAAGIDATIHLFLGTGHGPNLEAVRWIADVLAPARPQDWFVVLGMPYYLYKTSDYFAPPPRNMIFTGSIRHELKETMMALATTALCPMRLGTGSSLKAPDYLAHGKITLATPVGARGFSGIERVLSVMERDRFPAEIKRIACLLETDPVALDHQSHAGRAYVERHLSWENVVTPYQEMLPDAFRCRPT